ncbi:DUF2326 domain-containing protein [Pseudoalteromonas sp. APC 3213]|uniref:DUF2326 domain-containing protein n=1 Tax=Pseudoalteromonas sp. APC 3213 TaxID=3035178 RepID=UPI0025B3E3B6|nr:DUF2326 domain-containing protein [Pseudoalteromonas sp. APC 3213]MDN3401175.1 DUF2326 domain-containing protein [Pseudoalteromonas sp. APC 3213]
MFLDSLIVKNGDEIIREVPFHKGVNLIVDYTAPNSKKTDSGNSVGKTTVLRLIDFCLDGKANNLYSDPEFKDSNDKIKNFLTQNNINITLNLIKDIQDPKSKKISICRNFLPRAKKIQTINGEKCSNDEFSSKLKSLIFKTTSEKPTFKQLKSKNIRDEKNKLVNTIRVLSPYDTDVAYETLHLFWFGVDINQDKDELVRKQNLENRLQARLKKESTLSQVKQTLLIVDSEIERLTIKKDNFNLNPNYESQLESLNNAKQSINALSENISRLELRKELIQESVEDLNRGFSKASVEHIKKMYEQAKALIPNLQKSFEETLKFHNSMIQEKIDFISQDLEQLDDELFTNKQSLTHFLSIEEQLSIDLKKSGAVEELQDIISELNSFYEQKGKLTEQQSVWEKSNKELEKIEKSLNKMSSEVESKDILIQEKIADFNKIFSKFSSKLDGIHSLLSAESEKGTYKFSITNIEGNPGTGTKKSQMASFDLSYIAFADENEIPCLHFVLQDQIENVHANQITNLFTELVNQVNCQYVLPVLRDKLPPNIDISHLEVLSLSNKDKFFRLL